MRSFRMFASALTPGSLVSAVKEASSLASSSKKESYPPERITTSILLPDRDEDFDAFKNIITNKNIIFTSSWMDKWFGLKNLRSYCENFETKLRLAADGDVDVKMSPDDLEVYRKDSASAKQLALNRFFAMTENRDNLLRIYEVMTSDAKETGLGYYRFEDNEKKLLGGGALAPLTTPKKVDIALHILDPQRGIGSACIGILLRKAFEDLRVEEVWGSSMRDHPGTPTLCARHGMMIANNDDGMKHYYIDAEMWKATKGKERKIEEPIAASTHYAEKGDKKTSGRGGR